MKVVTPEISWHGKEAIFSIDVQAVIKDQPRRIATAGLDSNVRIWQVKEENVKFLSNLSRHDKAVNVVRFSKSGALLASAGDDSTIIIWKLNDKEEIPSIFEENDGRNVEVWNASKILRGHIEDINDLDWSYDDTYIATGSVDHNVILWDVEKGQKLAIFCDSKHFVNGVAWDPLGRYVAAMSCDRSLRIYNVQSKKLSYCVSKVSLVSKSDGQPQKSQRIFHDETVVRRRLSFTVDGKMLITPAGCIQIDASPQINTAMIFTRGNLSKPSVYLPGFKEPASVVACCPTLFQLRKKTNDPVFKAEYRNVFAVASTDTVLLYDTQQIPPFAMVSNIHYASITDLSWSSDASFLAVSSRDGFCSIIYFNRGEIGTPYVLADECEKRDICLKVVMEKEAVTVKSESKPLSTTNLSDTKVALMEHVETQLIKKETMLETKDGKEDICENDEIMETDMQQQNQQVPAATKQPHISSSPKPRRVTLTTVVENSPLVHSAFASQERPDMKPKVTKETKPALRRIQLTAIKTDE